VRIIYLIRIIDMNEREELIEQLVVGMKNIAHTIATQGTSLWVGVELTVPQIKILFLLYGNDGLPMKQLAEGLGTSVTAITGIVDRLVERGLVHRKAHPGDRRMVIASLTERGRDTALGFEESRQKWIGALFARLSTEKLRAIALAYDYLNEAIDAESGELQAPPELLTRWAVR
jgi:DNA-binding MarR family transcriptional regulator